MGQFRNLFSRGLRFLTGIGLAFGLSFAMAEPQSLQPFELYLPIDCQMGKTCWIFNYFDQDAGPSAMDYQQGHRTYNGHDGIDFGLQDTGRMKVGVSVLAAAPGVVRFIRDGEPDLLLGEKPFPTNKECGNGVLLLHENGFTTQYCHLKNGSIRVKSGDTVKTGQVLGQVGLSGQTEFPHVHLAFRHDGLAIDPFTGLPAQASPHPKGESGHATENGNEKPEGDSSHSYWAVGLKPQLRYQTGIMYHHGVSDHVEDAANIRAGLWKAPTLNHDTPLLNAWVDVLGIQPGDSLNVKITSPAGATVFDQTLPLTRTQAINFFQARMHRPQTGWMRGTYIIRYDYRHHDKREETVTDAAHFSS